MAGFQDIGKKRQQPRKAQFGEPDRGIGTLLGFMAGQGRQQNIGSTISDVQSQLKKTFPKGTPPGTSINVGGPSTTANIPVNREFTDAETNVIAGADKFEQLVADVQKQIDAGVLSSIPIAREYDQYRAEGGGSPFRRTLTPDDSELEKLASNLVELQKYAFTEGGKNLTPTELGVVKAGLSVFSKGNAAIKRDLGSAVDILRRKKALILGGSDALSSPIPDGNNQQQPQGRVRVRNKLTGQTGTISIDKLDPNKYEKV